MKKLFLKDVRTIEIVYDKSTEPEFDSVRTYSAFRSYIKANGLPNYISFDNDLGLGEDGKVAPNKLAAAKWGSVASVGIDIKLYFVINILLSIIYSLHF